MHESSKESSETNKTDAHFHSQSYSVEAQKKIDFFENMQRTLKDVRALRDKYEEEFEIDGIVPGYRKVNVWTHTFAKDVNTTALDRHAPALSVDDCEALYATMQVDKPYKMYMLAAMWKVSKSEARRLCYWLRKGNYMKCRAGEGVCIAVARDVKTAKPFF